jgi:hypothetical protein
MADPVTDAKIAELWPREWAKANDPTRRGNSKRRQQLRQAYARTLEMEQLLLRQPDARCGTCEHFELIPRDRTGQHHCSAESDFYGYVHASADNLCLKYKKNAK